MIALGISLILLLGAIALRAHTCHRAGEHALHPAFQLQFNELVIFEDA